MKAADIDRVEVGLEALTDLFIVAELVSGPIGVKPKAWVGFRRMHNLRAYGSTLTHRPQPLRL